jgi:acyl-CoA reductase-like NAD-dependent aldehyde dehydrogenase
MTHSPATHGQSVNPANGETPGRLSVGNQEQVDRAIALADVCFVSGAGRLARTGTETA